MVNRDETFEDQLSRLKMMSVDKGLPWDLSRNDQAAIKAVLKSHEALLQSCQRLVEQAEDAGWHHELLESAKEAISSAIS